MPTSPSPTRCAHLRERGALTGEPLPGSVAAVSVGVIDGEPRLDLPYEEDVRAETDMNVVMTGDGTFVEVQGTAEGAPFDRRQLDALLGLADKGCADLTRLQQARSRRTGADRRSSWPRATPRSWPRCAGSSLEPLPDVEVLGLDDVAPYDEPAETEPTFEGNALLKARAGAGGHRAARRWPTTAVCASTR